jgi:hypothetical protein
MRIPIVIFLLLSASLRAQVHPDSTDFRAPVDIPMYLAGNFGEIRPNHFHAGLDIKTQGREGIPIRCVEDGWVSRIKVSLTGYGTVVYVNHPNGYTSVYAHLQGFEKKIDDYLRTNQYEQESFLIELFPDSGEIQLSKGEVIALSGNTGGSGGPHLHFELHETTSEFPVNPLLFGFDIKDNIAPRLLRVGIYPLNEVSVVNGKSEAQYVDLVKSGSAYVLANGSIPKLKGKIGFGIEARDYLNGSSNRNGIYSIELRKDQVSVFQHEMRSFSFDETIFINSHVDYEHWMKVGHRVQRCYRQSGNQLSTYKQSVNDGQLFFLDSAEHRIEFIVSDSYGNSSKASMRVKSDQSQIATPSEESKKFFVKWQEENEIETPGFCLKTDSMGLFEDDRISLISRPGIGRAQSPIYSIDPSLAFSRYAHLFIDIPNLKKDHIDHYFLARLNNKMAYRGGTTGQVIDSTFWVDVKKPGNYTLMIDSVAPVIRLVSRGSASGGKPIRVEMKDKLNKVVDWDVYANDRWILSSYDRKTSILSISYRELNKLDREQSLRIEAVDNLGNRKTVNYSVTY